MLDSNDAGHYRDRKGNAKPNPEFCICLPSLKNRSFIGVLMNPMESNHEINSNPAPLPELIRKSLERNRLAHAYLLTGSELDVRLAATSLSKTLHCSNPPLVSESGVNLEFCDECQQCRDVERGRSPNTHWIRPSSRLRMITIQQMRDLSREIFLSPLGSPFKVGVVESAERMNREAANTFLKTLEEPPKKSVLILTSTQPDAVLDTLVSRCQRVACGGLGASLVTEEQRKWTQKLAQAAMANHEGLFARYRFLGDLTKTLQERREIIQEEQMEASPLSEDYELEPAHRKKLETEMNGIIEAEYRKSRESLIQGLTYWLRDVWIALEYSGNSVALPADISPELSSILYFPELADSTHTLAGRINSAQARHNLEILEKTQIRLSTNADQNLTLETALLELRF